MTPIESAVKTLYWFFLYGFIGWGVEVVYAAIKERRLVNRGFLCGPICPIYGCGMVVLNWTVAALAPSGEGKSVSTVAVFFVGMVLTTAIELVGGWTLFKIYHIRWWDYSNMKFNIGGYICPQFSLLWGLGSVIMVKVVHPALAKASSPLPMKVLVPAEAAVLALFVVDLIVSAAAATGLNKKLKEIDGVADVSAHFEIAEGFQTVQNVLNIASRQRHDRRYHVGRAKAAAGPGQAGRPRERRRVEAGNAAACQRNARQAA